MKIILQYREKNRTIHFMQCKWICGICFQKMDCTHPSPSSPLGNLCSSWLHQAFQHPGSSVVLFKKFQQNIIGHKWFSNTNHYFSSGIQLVPSSEDMPLAYYNMRWAKVVMKVTRRQHKRALTDCGRHAILQTG